MVASSKVRLRFAKTGDLRLVSHRDLMRCLERTVRRAGLPVAYSQGFNPRPRIVFALALALGTEALREVVELELTEPLGPSEVLRRLSAFAPEGFEFTEAEATGPGRSAKPEVTHYALPVPPDRLDAASAALQAFLASGSWPITRVRPGHGHPVERDLRPFVLDARTAADGLLRFSLKIDPGGSARPEEVLEALGLRDLLARGCVLVRTDIGLAPSATGRPRPASGPDDGVNVSTSSDPPPENPQ